MRLPSLKIHGYRALEQLTVPNLGRVNLIVGRNNSGKSTLLEALRVLAARSSRECLKRILAEHDEDGFDVGFRDRTNPFRNLFAGRQFPSDDNEEIYIGSADETQFIKIRHVLLVEEEIQSEDDGETVRRLKPTILTREKAETEKRPVLDGLLIRGTGDHERLFRIEPINRRFPVAVPEQSVIPIGFVPTEFVAEEQLAERWDQIALRPEADLVLDALRIIEPDVEALAFIQRSRLFASRSEETNRFPVVKLRGSNSPVALSSMGDGMLRVLQLLLCMFPAAGGIFLIDEFENGLHYSVQEKVWRLVFSVAERHAIQVFAATHSWDCIDAFRNSAAELSPDSILLRLGRSVRQSDRGRIIATSFNVEQLATLTQADAEVR